MIKIQDYLDRKDIGWLATLFGTAVGAGILYLPVNAAKAGILPLIIISVLSVPAIWMAHRNLTRFCLSASDPTNNITETVIDKFGKLAAGLFIAAYFMAIYPILLLYSISLTNVINDIIINYSSYAPPPRYITSFVVLFILSFIIIKGEKWVSAASEILVLPLLVILFFCALYFIPVWHPPTFGAFTWTQLVKACVLMSPLIVFSFNHSPSCSAFAQAYRLQYKSLSACHTRVARVLKLNVTLLTIIILPFVFSCVLSMTPDDISYATKYNIPALISISSAGYVSWMPIVISIITLLAITSSYFGVYIGSHEGATGLVNFIRQNTAGKKSFKSMKNIYSTIHIFLFVTSWIMASFDVSIIKIIQNMVAPVLAIIMFIVPIIAMYLLKELKSYRSPLADLYTLIFGLIIIFGFVISMLTG